MKNLNLLEDPEGSPEKKSTEFDEEITPDTLDELIQTREEPSESEVSEPAAFQASEEAVEETPSEENVETDNDFHDSGFESSFPKKRLFIILGVIGVLILGGLLLFILLSTPEEGTPTAAVEKAPPAETAAQPTPAQPAVDPALMKKLAVNKAHNEALTRVAASIFSTRAGAAVPVLAVTEGNNVVVTIKAPTADDAARFRIILKDKNPGITIASMGKSVNAGGQGGYWDLAIPISPATPAGGGIQAQPVEPSQFTSGLKQLATQNGLRNLKIQTGPQLSDGAFKNQVFYLAFRGKISGIIAFLNQLSADYPSARIHKIRVGFPNFKTNTSMAEAQIDIYLLTK